MRVVSGLSLLQRELITQGKLEASREFKAGGLNPQDPTSKRVARNLDRRLGPGQSREMITKSMLRVVRRQTPSSGTVKGRKAGKEISGHAGEEVRRWRGCDALKGPGRGRSWGIPTVCFPSDHTQPVNHSLCGSQGHTGTLRDLVSSPVSQAF